MSLAIEGHVGDRPDMARQVEELLAVRRVPELDAAVLARRGQQLAIRRQGDPVDGIGSREFPQRTARRNVPQLDGIVGAARGDGMPGRMKRQAENEVLMAAGASEGLDFLAGGRVPELDGLVKAAGDHVLAVRAESNGVNRLGMSFERNGAGRQVAVVRRDRPGGQNKASAKVVRSIQRPRQVFNMGIATSGRGEGRRERTKPRVCGKSPTVVAGCQLYGRWRRPGLCRRIPEKGLAEREPNGWRKSTAASRTPRW